MKVVTALLMSKKRIIKLFEASRHLMSWAYMTQAPHLNCCMTMLYQLRATENTILTKHNSQTDETTDKLKRIKEKLSWLSM